VRSAADRRFDELYEQHFRHVLAYCLRRIPSADAYDAANEVFAIAWRRIEDVPAGEAARPWLFVVARRVVFRRRRSARRFRNLVGRAVALRESSPPDPESVVVLRAEYDLVLRAASRLSRDDREILNLAAWEGLPHREIADMLGCSIAAVDQRLHRAKERLAGHYHALQRAGTLPHAVGGEGS
jgi:RNA polymerase sigma-70 factor (ECF subfamily)